MAPTKSRQYDLVLLGATGYTGKLCAEHITNSLPTNLKWAVSGRSHERLSAIVEELRSHDSDRIQPTIEAITLSLDDLRSLARKTRIVLNTVGPYYKYSSPVVQACAENGTHYLDVTGETPWVYEMIEKHHDTAKASGAIIIPEIGLESAPSDLLAWSLATLIREKLSVGTKEVITSVHTIDSQPSGGTLATATGILDHYSLSEFAKASAPWALSPIPGPKPSKTVPLATKLFGIRKLKHLGVLTTSLTAGPNVAIVQRSWGLSGGPKLYGPNFQYNEYMRVKNTLAGFIIHAAICLGFIAMMIPPVRWMVQWAAHNIYAPGQGASKHNTAKDTLEFRAIAEADQADVPNPQMAMARFRHVGGIYYMTGLFLAEAAMVLLSDDDLTESLGGGLLTPAMLGQPFVDRLRNAGVTLECRIMPEQQ
ncbi:MAG: hypothetical protein L6R40_000065 [Gallowayella cf. fulva]|nr:MAG: hypothetical protein L6R40_000065 [Xanthomendoza cf. fulva]